MPLPCNFLKLVDVEEMSYYASNGEGEVCSADIEGSDAKLMASSAN